jgi:hypothetical protein
LQGRLAFVDVVRRLFLLLLLDVFVWLLLREMLLLRGRLKVIDSLKSSSVKISLLISLWCFVMTVMVVGMTLFGDHLEGILRFA